MRGTDAAAEAGEGAARRPVRERSCFGVACVSLPHQERERGPQSTCGVCIFCNHLSGFGLLGPGAPQTFPRFRYRASAGNLPTRQ